MVAFADGHDENRDEFDDELLTISDIARILKMDKRTVARKRAAGAIPPALLIGGSLRWSSRFFYRWIAAGCPKLPTGDNDRRRK